MGRKPNPVITKHFNRGIKLPDNSNRYEHSCKHCGEKFPKGRLDNLQGHVIKQCPAITPADRADAVRELRATNGLGGDGDELPLNSGSQSANTREGLYALADAALIGIGAGEASPGQNLEKSASKRLKLTEQYSLDHPPPNLDGASAPRGRGGRGNKIEIRSRDGKSQARGKGVKTVSSQSRPSPSGFITGAQQLENVNTSIQTHAALALTSPFGDGNSYEASYENNFIPQHLRMDSGHQTMIDPDLQEIEAATRAIVSPGFLTNAQNGRIEQPDWSGEALPDDYSAPRPGFNEGSGHFYDNNMQQEVQARYNSSFYQDAPIPAPVSPPAAEFNTELGNGKRVSKQKPRGKFDEKRKAEVRELRVKGACVRCRMLKKSCSPGDPCEPCRNIEDPRVWTHPCTRDRLGTLFFQLKSGIYSSIAYASNISKLKDTPSLDRAKPIIDVSQCPEHGIWISFKTQWVTHKSAVPGHEVENENQVLDSRFPNGSLMSDPQDRGARSGNMSGVLILEHESDDVPSKVQEYMVQVVGSQRVVDIEPSAFVKRLLEAAIALSPISDITKMALEMFVMVSTLLDENLTWTMSERAVDDSPGSGRVINPSSESYRLIELQLKAGAEKKAGDLVEKVVRGIDHLLLRADSKQRYDLFIVGLLVLTVLERVTWDFTKWVNHDKQPYSWPHSSKTPEEFVQQRQKVASLLNFMLRIREVPAPTEVDSRGVLFTGRDDESQVLLKKLGLSEQHVMQRFHMELSDHYDQNNSRCFEMSLCAWLLLPDRLLPKNDKQTQEESDTVQGEQGLRSQC